MLPILGYRIGPFAYITDASFLAETEIARLQGLEALVVNALHREKHYSHFNLEQALQFIDIVKPKHAYLTHTSHHMGLYADVAKILPPPILKKSSADGRREKNRFQPSGHGMR